MTGIVSVQRRNRVSLLIVAAVVLFSNHFFVSLPACHGLASLPPIGRLAVFKSEATIDFHDIHDLISICQDEKIEALNKVKHRLKFQELQEMLETKRGVSSMSGRGLRPVMWYIQNYRAENPKGYAMQYFESEIATWNQTIEMAEFCHKDSCTDFQVLELMYEYPELYQAIQQRAKNAKDIFLPVYNYALEKEKHIQELEKSAEAREGFPSPPRKTKQYRRALRLFKRIAKQKSSEKEIEDAPRDRKTQKMPFTFEASYFKDGALESSSQEVWDEYKQLLYDHKHLITKSGADYGDKTPWEKLMFLSEIESVEDRWEVLFARAKLMGALNPARQQEDEVFLKEQGNDGRRIQNEAQTGAAKDALRRHQGVFAGSRSRTARSNSSSSTRVATYLRIIIIIIAAYDNR